MPKPRTARSAGSREPCPPRGRTATGFTLIELMVVIVILGILAAIAIPNYSHARERARRSSCISNQRNSMEAGYLYITDFRIVDQNLSSLALFNAGYLPAGLTECPESGVVDHDDYLITVVGGHITNVTCLVFGVDHELNP